jgi:4-amino-4-deoxyprephenate dehydrogenase
MRTDRPTFVILGGAGAMGRWFTARLAPEGDVIGVDLCAPPSTASPATFVQMDVCHGTRERAELIRRADTVVVCVPESVALHVAHDTLDLMRPGTLWVDTLSVKVPIVTRLISHRDDVEALSISPLFGGSIEPHGQCVLAVAVREGPRSHAFHEALRGWGVSVERLSAEEHDRHTSAIQVLTHATMLAFGHALHALGYDLSDRPEATTPPMRTLLALLARLLSLSPHVYGEIQRANPFAGEARAALVEAVKAVEQAVLTGDQAALDGIARSAEAVLGARQEQYQRLCAHIFAVEGQWNGNTR